MTTDRERLSEYVETWQGAVDDVVALLRDLTDDEWSRPTDLPGWDVRAVAAHLAHLESELSGAEQVPVEVPELEHLTAPSGRHTEAGRVARESLENAELVDELERVAGVRAAELREHPPTDGSGTPPITPAGVSWDWDTLLRNRVVDVWMHEQDIRRALGRPGGMNRPAAAHTLRVLTAGFPYVVGKRVGPPEATTVVLDVTGLHPVHLAVEMSAEGRAVVTTSPVENPTVTLRMDAETYLVLAGGRASAENADVSVSGDPDLGRRLLANMALTR